MADRAIHPWVVAMPTTGDDVRQTQVTFGPPITHLSERRGTVNIETPATFGTPIMPSPEQCNDAIVTNVACERRHFRNRMLICLVAIAANFGTTLRIAKNFAARVIDVPSLDFVTDTCKAAYGIVKDERSNYSICVETQLKQCNTKLERTTKLEDNRIIILTRHNEDVVRRVEGVATNCSKSYTTLRLALEDWTANGGEIPLRTNVISTTSTDLVCSAEDQALFNQTMLGTQNTLALQTEALQTATTYSDESALTVSRLASTVTDLTNERSSITKYIEERAKYDVDYLDQKTQNTQDGLYDIIQSLDPGKIPPVDLDDIFWEMGISAKNLMACVSLDLNARMVDGSACQPNLAKMVDDFVVDAKWKVAFLSQTLYNYRDRMEEYKQNVAGAYTVAKRFYEGKVDYRYCTCLHPPISFVSQCSCTDPLLNILGATTFINIARKVVFWENVGDWFDISVTDLLPRNVNFPDVDVAVGKIGSFGSINTMWQKVLPKIDAYYASFGPVKTRIKARFMSLIEGIMMNHSASVLDLIPRILPNDYNPPKFSGTVDIAINPEEEVSLYKNKTEVSALYIRQLFMHIFSNHTTCPLQPCRCSKPALGLLWECFQA
jgi:hypothetical protein